MKRAILTCIVLFAFVSSGSAVYNMKALDGRIEFGISCGADAVLQAPAYGIQGLYNFTQNFYAGARLSYFGNVNIVSKIDRREIYNDNLINADVVLGAQTGTVCERYSLYVEALPGFTHITRNLIYADNGLDKDLNRIQGGQTVLATTVDTRFSPGFELGFKCSLTDNLVLSTGFTALFIDTGDISQEPSSFIIPIGPQEYVLLNVPVRLSWRF